MKSTELNPTDPGHVICAVPRHTTFVLLNGDKRRTRTVTPESMLHVHKVETHPTEKRCVWLTLTDNTDLRVLAQARDFHWYIGQIPDFRTEFYLVGYGYQVDHFDGYLPMGGECRDFGGTYPVADLVRKLYRASRSMTNHWRKGK